MHIAAVFGPVRFSTDNLPVRDRLSAWRDFIGPRVFGGDVEPAPNVPFRSDVTVRQLPGFRLMSAEGSPARYARTRPFLADGNDHFGLHLNSAGCTVCQRGREIAPDPGDAVLISAAEAGVVVSPSIARFSLLFFPRAELAPLVAGLDDAVLRRVTPQSDALRYLLGYLRFLGEQQALPDPGLARSAAVHVRDLFALVLGATRDAAVIAEAHGLRAARLQTIKRYVADNLSQRELTVGGVAADHRVAPRYVQRLFEGEGTTFSEYVLNERLARAFRMLGDPAHAGTTVSAIALEAGFGDVSYFNRRFRRHFGVTPSDVRAAAQRKA